MSLLVEILFLPDFGDFFCLIRSCFMCSSVFVMLLKTFLMGIICMATYAFFEGGRQVPHLFDASIYVIAVS